MSWGSIVVKLSGGVALTGFLVGLGVQARAQLATTNSSPATISIWGAGDSVSGTSPLAGVLSKLEADYRDEHPSVIFLHHLSGNDSALGGVYVGRADIALMDREPSYIELDGYQQVIAGQKPLELTLMRGGTASAGHSSPLVVVANRKAPLTSLSVEQLRSIFDASRHSAGGDRIQIWGDLKLAGEWSKRPIKLYGFGVETSEARSFSTAVMGDSRLWVCAYHEVEATRTQTAAERIVAAVERDPGALGITTFDALTPHTKVIAIRDQDGVEVGPTDASLEAARYMLGRTVLALAKAHPDGSTDLKINNFLQYLLSARAQSIIAVDGAYIRLDERELDRERKLLR